jgi:hypothetical protein
MCRRLLVLLVALVLVAPPVGLASNRSASAAGGIPLFQPADRLDSPARGTTARAEWFAGHYGAKRGSDVALYINELYRLAPMVGLNPAIIIAQSALETDTWRTVYWSDHLNPAGIGITSSGSPSYTWNNGTDAARGHLVHFYLYAVGEVRSGNILYPYKSLDPRYDAAVSAGYAGIADTINDLTGRWATDPNYAPKIAGRGNDIFIRHRLLGTGHTSNSSSAALADDASGATAWVTITSTPPDAAFMWVDLGEVRSIGTIRWLFKETGYADLMRVQVSTDRATWTTIGRFGNAPALQWQGVAYQTQARYVRFRFSNPNRDPKLGSLAEVQVWPPTVPALAVTNTSAAAADAPLTSLSTGDAPPTATPATSRLATTTPSSAPISEGAAADPETSTAATMTPPPVGRTPGVRDREGTPAAS